MINFLLLLNLIFPFLIHNECKPIPDSQRDAVTTMSFPMTTNPYDIAFCSYVLILFCPLSCILNALSSYHDSTDIFSSAVHEFRNLF